MALTPQTLTETPFLVGLFMGLAFIGISFFSSRRKSVSTVKFANEVVKNTDDSTPSPTSIIITPKKQVTPVKQESMMTPPQQREKTASEVGSVCTPAGRRSARIARKKIEHID
mmetsp:Transcript_1895/g.3673  ORF Transcript_1895/g.3673 Transcript_1895/m.3673 type:complete len:113 (+) Transcript_1895:86-424(+)